MTETFLVKVQAQGRVLIPTLYRDSLKLKRGDKVRISIEKVKP